MKEMTIKIMSSAGNIREAVAMVSEDGTEAEIARKGTASFTGNNLKTTYYRWNDKKQAFVVGF